MPCRSPLTGYKAPDGSIKFGDRSSTLGRFGLLTFRCGVCRDCRLHRAREWAIRCYHEGQLHEESCFLDLTFRDEPPTVSKRDLQLFFKRLRKSLPGIKLRYFAVGEYGEQFERPHYHVVLFGWNPKDRYPWRRSPKGTLLYRSPHLERVWTAGHVTVSDITEEAAGYAARYTLKKINGDRAEEHYGGRHPEFNLSSNKLGLGWIEKYYRDIWPKNDFVVFKGKECPVPRYYFKWLEQHHPELADEVREKREDYYAELPYETGLRIHQAAKARDTRTKALKRDYESPSPSARSSGARPGRH